MSDLLKKLKEAREGKIRYGGTWMDKEDLDQLIEWGDRKNVQVDALVREKIAEDLSDSTIQAFAGSYAEEINEYGNNSRHFIAGANFVIDVIKEW